MEKGVLSSLVEVRLSEIADDLTKLKGVFEMADGHAYLFVFRNIDNTVGEKVPEPYKTEIRDTLDKILLEKNYKSAIVGAMDFANRLLDIPLLDDETEELFFKGMALAIAGLLAKLDTDGDE